MMIMLRIGKSLLGLWLLLSFEKAAGQTLYRMKADLEQEFRSPSEMAKPWVFWYWMQAAVSKPGITADLEAMKEAGIGGAYLMPIKGAANPPYTDSPVVQLTPRWWDHVRFAFSESRRLGIKLGFHASDGFALAGGPWITPELSMQKLVWTRTNAKGGQRIQVSLPQPQTNEGYYRDIAVYAFPLPAGAGISSFVQRPKISSSKNDSAVLLLSDPANRKNFTSEDPCWIQYQFNEPFTLRSIHIRSRNNYQANRLLLQVSEDGLHYRDHFRMKAPRHGWQDTDEDYTHAIPEVRARYFRLVYDRAGSEPGAEDLDAAKWKQSLKLQAIGFSSDPVVHQYEGKNGSVWRISESIGSTVLPDALCVPPSKLIRIPARDGKIDWQAPAGNWVLLRMGHTSTGHKNETAGGGKGLECDKFSTKAVTLQFREWFGQLYQKIDPADLKEVLRYFHVDSWECGSQNWTSDFADQFRKRRGYDLLPLLPVMAGFPVESAKRSETILLDVRKTIAELVNDRFYETLAQLVHAKGLQFSAESIAPTMMSDGMLHYAKVDVPMGEFWLRSPTHDKPNDMLDAISGAHVYGKPLVAAEGFTELRMHWDEHPGMLKSLLDRNLALGMNRLFFHVMVHNPWTDRKPGMTLDPIGLFFQRDQTWWKQASGFTDYVRRCQALLQLGRPVQDLAVFTGENYPKRALLPERLVQGAPSLFDSATILREQKRLRNEGLPMRQLPVGVNGAANITDPASWSDRLNGFAYDAVNEDALYRLARVENGRIRLPGGASYRLLVWPGPHPLAPDEGISARAIQRIRSLLGQGARIAMPSNYIRQVAGKQRTYKGEVVLGKGRLYALETLQGAGAIPGLRPDFLATDTSGKGLDSIAWTHRQGADFDLYFLSNQSGAAIEMRSVFSVRGWKPEIWDPVSGSIFLPEHWSETAAGTEVRLSLDAYGSAFVVFRMESRARPAPQVRTKSAVGQNWTVQFDTAFGGPASVQQWSQLQDWSRSADSAICYYSGTAAYRSIFTYVPDQIGEKLWLRLQGLNNIAEVIINGRSCGFAWTAPYRVDITSAVKQGANEVKILVSNTWANRLIGDQRLEKDRRRTFTIYTFPMKDKPLLPAGLLGPVVLEVEQ